MKSSRSTCLSLAAVLPIEPHACLAIHVMAAQLAAPRSPIVPDDSVGHTTDPVAGVRDSPAKVYIGAVGESFVEPADRVKHLTAKGEVGSTAFL